jgi:hypothetical protein
MRHAVEFGGRLNEGGFRVAADPAFAPTLLPERSKRGVLLVLVAVAVAYGSVEATWWVQFRV